jgi:hypothetical protein
MAFRPPRANSARWRPVAGDGREHLTLRPLADGIVAESVLIGEDSDGVPYGVHYRIVCDTNWVVMSLELDNVDGRSVRLRSDGRGAWTDASGAGLPALDGCIDIDLAGTPFTNTLPIRRLSPAPEAGAVAMTMVYIPFDTFAPTVDGQVYRCLETERLYRYEAADHSFTADITVDQDGLVVDYPTLFTRM